MATEYVLSRSQVAKIAGKTVSAVRKAQACGHLPSRVNAVGRHRFRRYDVDQWLSGGPLKAPPDVAGQSLQTRLDAAEYSAHSAEAALKESELELQSLSALVEHEKHENERLKRLGDAWLGWKARLALELAEFRDALGSIADDSEDSLPAEFSDVLSMLSAEFGDVLAVANQSPDITQESTPKLSLKRAWKRSAA